MGLRDQRVVIQPVANRERELGLGGVHAHAPGSAAGRRLRAQEAQRKLAGMTVDCGMCGLRVDETRTRLVLAEQGPHLFKDYGLENWQRVQVCDTCEAILPKKERKARRVARATAFLWACMGAALLFGLLGYFWHPLWALAGFLGGAFVVLWVLGWFGLIGLVARESWSAFRRKQC